MRGWDAVGHEVSLTGYQAAIVEKIAAWEDDGKRVILPGAGRGYGKTVVLATISGYQIRREPGESLAGAIARLNPPGDGSEPGTAVTVKPGKGDG